MLTIAAGAVSFVVIVSILSYVSIRQWETMQYHRHYSKNLKQLVDDINHNDQALYENDKKIMTVVKAGMTDVQKVLAYQQTQMDTIGTEVNKTQAQLKATSILTPATLESRDQQLKSFFKAEAERLAKQIEEQRNILRATEVLAKNNDGLANRHTNAIAALQKQLEEQRLVLTKNAQVLGGQQTVTTASLQKQMEDLRNVAKTVETIARNTETLIHRHSGTMTVLQKQVEDHREALRAVEALAKNGEALANRHSGSISALQKEGSRLDAGINALTTRVTSQDAMTQEHLRQLKDSDASIVASMATLGGRVDGIQKQQAALQASELSKHITITPSKGLSIDAKNVQANGTIGTGTHGNMAAFMDPTGLTKSDKLQLGNKWLLSGVGDDEWLRLMDMNGKDYYGGIAAGKVWAKGDGWFNGVITNQLNANGNAVVGGNMVVNGQQLATRGTLKIDGDASFGSNATVNGNVRASRVQLGNKWVLSGVGDGIANDDWLRMTQADGKTVHGGIAMNKLWVGGEGYIDTATANKLKLGNKFALSGVGNDEWLRLTDATEKNYYGGVAMNRAWVGKDAWMGELQTNKVCIGGNCITAQTMENLKKARVL